MAEILEQFSRLSVEEKPSKTTGLVFNDLMKEHRCMWDANHIERPERYIFSLERCKTYGLVDRCKILPSKRADLSDITELHDADYINNIAKSVDITDETELESFSSTFDSLYFNNKTYDCALLAAGCTINLVTSVLSGEIKNGMAIVRPPGHHAMFKEACGFCVFNNVALAAKHAIDKHNIKRILIVDWDVHHGQATQQMFYNDSRVLYFSIHRYEYGAFWPNLRESQYDYIGAGSGKGFNINVPLNKIKLGNTEYLAIFNNILLPVAYEFNPELILISAGYDAALGCPEGEMEVTPCAYAHMVSLLMGLANGKLCVVLEGGYCLPSLSESVALTLRTLLGDPCPMLLPNATIDESVVETILNVITVVRKYWKSLQIQLEYQPLKDQAQGAFLHVLKSKYLGPETNSKPLSYPTRNTYPVQDLSVRLALEAQLEKIIGSTNLSVPESKTCLIYDSKMNSHINRHEKDHPECAERLTSIYKKLEMNNLLKDCLCLESRKATDNELNLIHSKEYIDKMKSTKAMKSRELIQFQDKYESVYLCQDTYEASTIACGSLLEIVDTVFTNKSSNGFALVRPPGHHAEIDEAYGFCIFNHVAVAAKYAMTKHFVQKVLILDWDVHHGNGTQHIFYDSNKVLYISFHRYDYGSFFPSSEDGNFTACGTDAGLGFNINIPWNHKAKDGDYLAAFFHIILPVAYEFCPDLVLISSGFDAVQNDPLGDFELTPSFYGVMTKLLSGLANGKIILCLEGGYNLEQTSEASLQCLKILLGHSCEPLQSDLYASPAATKCIQDVVKIHQQYWRCLQFGVQVPEYVEEPISVLDNTIISSPVTIPNRDELSNVIYIDVEVLQNATSSSPDGGSDVNLESLPEFYCVSPLEWCPHLEFLQSIPPEGLNINAECQICSDTNENWVCLHCYQVYCGRFVNEHMLMHGLNMQHYLTLSYQDLSVWCYGCDSYIHNELLVPVKQHAHLKKFGTHFG